MRRWKLIAVLAVLAVVVCIWLRTSHPTVEAMVRGNDSEFFLAGHARCG
jgi:hypothetical protein